MSNLSIYDIKDTEIRIIGQDFVIAESRIKLRKKPERKGCRWTWGILLLLLILGIVLLLLFIMPKSKHRESDSVYSDSAPIYLDEPSQEVYYAEEAVSSAPANDVNVYTIVERKTVDDIPVRLLEPTGGRVEVALGPLDTDDASIVLAAQAADYRADNGKIAGAFVYRGELLSRGHPKLGFCAIIGREVTMGMSPETPLFERAVEQSGYFFRQFALVHDGELGENTPTGKSIRRALCYDGSRLFVADTEGRESYHDFAQALIDMGVKEALSLVGSIPLPLYEDEQGNRVVQELPHSDGVTETYIVWRR